MFTVTFILLFLFITVGFYFIYKKFYSSWNTLKFQERGEKVESKLESIVGDEKLNSVVESVNNRQASRAKESVDNFIK